MKKILSAILPTKAPAEPSLGERYGAALALHGAATSIFRDVHDDLVQAEAELTAIAQEADAKIVEARDAHNARLDELGAGHEAEVRDLAAMRNMAYDDAVRAYDRARQIAPLVA